MVRPQSQGEAPMVDDSWFRERVKTLAQSAQVKPEPEKPKAPARDPLARPPARQAPPPRSPMGPSEVVRSAGPKLGLSGGLRALQRFGGVGASTFVSGLFMDSRPDTGQEADFLNEQWREHEISQQRIADALAPENLELPVMRDVSERRGVIHVPVEGRDLWLPPVIAPAEIPQPLPMEDARPELLPVGQPAPHRFIPWSIPAREPLFDPEEPLPEARVRLRDMGSHVEVLLDRKGMADAKKPRRERDQKSNKSLYTGGLALINATYGAVDEIQDFIEALLWGVWFKRGDHWVPAMQVYGGDSVKALRSVLEGRSIIDPVSILENVAFNEMEDRYYAARGQLLLASFRRLGMQSIPGPQTQNLGGFNVQSPLSRTDLRARQARRVSWLYS